MEPKQMLAVFLLFLSAGLFAQKGIIEGLITDAESKSPLNGASILIPRNKGDNSDMFGKFRISAVNPGQYELIISHISYITEIIPVEVKENLVSSVSVSLKRGNLNLAEIKINGKKNSSLNTISLVDIMLRPVNTSQDILRIVPGLFIAQHAGGGKAEQIFLRGYDIDHGTDINISVDGMPVNMVSHAHGQGYADLHFLIPETVEKINFDKGPYFSNKGNLATAGFVEFTTKEFLKDNSIKFEAGQFNTQRTAGLLKIINKESENQRQQLYTATEYFTSDGYFEKPQNFHRFNFMSKYNAWFGTQTQLTVIASSFNSKWNASGQVPDRAVHSGMISRFGAIDDSEGGYTSRSNLNIRFAKQLKNNWKMTDQFYYTHYKFRLYSNFTFFLKDSVNGDEILQKEKRNIYGYNSTASKSWVLGNINVNTELGGGFRYDDVKDIELSKAVKRNFIASIQKGDVKELNSYLFSNQSFEISKTLAVNGGIRFDYFRFAYKNVQTGENDFNYQDKSILSPKLNFVFSPSSTVKIYFNNGIGFHSNDARLILSSEAKSALPKVFGTDLGIIFKPIKNLVLETALWRMFSQQEFVYVGDEGIIEAGGRTRRIGFEYCKSKIS